MHSLESGTTSVCTGHLSVPDGVSTQVLIPAVVQAYCHYITTRNSRAWSGGEVGSRRQVQTINLIANQSTVLTSCYEPPPAPGGVVTKQQGCSGTQLVPYFSADLRPAGINPHSPGAEGNHTGDLLH